MTVERLSDKVCDMVVDALTRMMTVGEEVDSVEFSLTMMPTQQGMVIAGVIYIAIKGPLLGTVLGNADVVLDLSALASQDGVDWSVRASLDAIRSRKASILAGTNGHSQHRS